MLLRCISVMYIAGSFSLIQGVKSSQKNTFNSGVVFRNRGTGWGEVTTSSELILRTENESFDIIKFFQSRWGRMTEKRRKAIIATMPKQIHKDQNGLSDNDMVLWLDRAKEYR